MMTSLDLHRFRMVTCQWMSSTPSTCIATLAPFFVYHKTMRVTTRKISLCYERVAELAWEEW